MNCVPTELLETLAAEAPQHEQKEQKRHQGNGQFDIEDFIRKHNLDVTAPKPWKGSGRVWEFRTSPMCEHNSDGAWIGQQPDGAITAGCQHTCTWKWDDLRERFEPKAERRAKASTDRDGKASDEIFSNATVEKVGESTITRPRPMADILRDLRHRTGDWPRRVASVLFVHDTEHGLSWVESASSLFGWLSAKLSVVKWRDACGCVTKPELYAELRRTSPAYQAVEVLPHEPPIQNIYYACPFVRDGNGTALQGLLERFRPSTLVDFDLIKGMFATVFWGGVGGSRPAFVITSDAGRGKGKSKLATMVGYLAGGAVELSTNEEAGKIRERLLSPEGITKRVALLDNVKSLRFSWAELEGMITAPVISGKRMYVGEASRPNTLTWIITLNGPSLATDMAQRSVVIKLDKPPYDPTWEEATYAYIAEQREAIIGDILAFLKSDPQQLTKYSRWGAWERDVLSRLTDPVEGQRVIAERQADIDVEGEESDIVEQFFGDQLTKLGYDPEQEAVHIPVGVAAEWFNLATAEKHRVTGVSRLLGQMIKEGRLRSIQRDPSRTHGRGFLWAATLETSVWHDLEDRIAASAKRWR